MCVTYAMSFYLYYVLLILKTIERYPLGSLPDTDAETEAMVSLQGVQHTPQSGHSATIMIGIHS